MAFRILAVDDDAETTGALKRLLEARGYVVQEENDSTKALRTAREFQPHAIVLDYLMPHCHGGDVAWQLWCDPRLKHTKVVVCTGVAKAEVSHHLPPGTFPIFEKPVDGAFLLNFLESILIPGGREAL
jgi:two-component system chemotaxis response regulator CheY